MEAGFLQIFTQPVGPVQTKMIRSIWFLIKIAGNMGYSLSINAHGLLTINFTKGFWKIRLKEDDFSGRLSGKFPGAREHLKRQSCFFWRNVPTGNLCSICSEPSLTPGDSRFSCPFWELICTNGKCDSGTNFTIAEFCLPFAQTVNQPVCSCK